MTREEMEKEAREAAEEHRSAIVMGGGSAERVSGEYDGYLDGYKEAAEPRDKENEALRAELDDWRESARKAIEEPCGDERHCACVGLMKHQLVRQAQRIVEADEEIGCMEKIAQLAMSLAEEFERAVASRNPVGGMSVSPSGDFIACAQLPSAVSRMRWWAREVRRAQAQWSEIGE